MAKLSTLATQLERNSLGILDVENLVRHYTLTLKGWLNKFRAAYPALDHKRYDESFRRMWEYYLACGIDPNRAKSKPPTELMLLNPGKVV